MESLEWHELEEFMAMEVSERHEIEQLELESFEWQEVEELASLLVRLAEAKELTPVPEKFEQLKVALRSGGAKSTRLLDKLMYHAYSKGHVEMAQWLHGCVPMQDIDAYLRMAVRHQHLDLIEWMVRDVCASDIQDPHMARTTGDQTVVRRNSSTGTGVRNASVRYTAVHARQDTTGAGMVEEVGGKGQDAR